MHAWESTCFVDIRSTVLSAHMYIPVHMQNSGC